MDYHGYYVKEAALSASVPVIEWFIADADYADMHANHVFDNVYLPCVIVLDNEVYDNAKVRIKGEITRNYTKKQYKFKLPAGYTIDVPGGSSIQENEFHMNAEYHTGTMGHTLGAWWVVKESGILTPDIIVTRLQRNGNYEGLYTYSDKYENGWRQANGYNNGPFYEDYTDIVSGTNDYTAIDSWRDNMIRDEQDPVKRDYVLDNNNIPNMFNYMSAKTILSSWDHYAATNTMEYRDNSTERWSLLYWDLSSAFSTDQNKSHYPSPHDHDDSPAYDSRFMDYAIYGQKDLRELYFRRLRTLVDKFYATDELKNKFLEYEALYDSEMDEDIAKWPPDMMQTNRPKYDQGYAFVFREIKRHLMVLHRQPWAIPPAQTDPDRQSVSFAEVVPNATDSDEYIRLYNTANTPVDLSDWVIEGRAIQKSTEKKFISLFKSKIKPQQNRNLKQRKKLLSSCVQANLKEDSPLSYSYKINV
jgi:hypothetical protein